LRRCTIFTLSKVRSKISNGAVIGKINGKLLFLGGVLQMDNDHWKETRGLKTVGKWSWSVGLAFFVIEKYWGGNGSDRGWKDGKKMKE
jgi:hypothetical protein